MEIEYKCHWPNCEYETTDRCNIELHHIVPRELRPRLNQFVTLSYCPTHHRMIFHPESRHGHHSLKTDNKLKILNIYPTAPEGYAIEYENMRGDVFYEVFDGTYRNGIEEIDKDIFSP